MLLTLALTSTWLLSLRPVRLKIGDYYYNQGNFDQAIRWYGNVIRKIKLQNFYREGSQFQSHTVTEEEPFTKLSNACLNLGIFHSEESKKYLSTNPKRAELKLREFLRVYESFSRIVHNGLIRKVDPESPRTEVELSSVVKRACANLAEIYKTEKPKKILELYWTLLGLESTSGDASFTKEWAQIFPSFTGINLLENPYLADLNRDGAPDDYTSACVGQAATFPNKEIIKMNEFNIYHVWQKGGNGWSR